MRMIYDDGKMAQVAYEAYKKAAGGKSLATGATLPEWDTLKFEIREAWAVAADAAVRHFESYKRKTTYKLSKREK